MECMVSAAKWLHKIRFLAGSGDGAVDPALFIDGKFTSGQTAGGKKTRGFQQLKTEIAEEASGNKERIRVCAPVTGAQARLKERV